MTAKPPLPTLAEKAQKIQVRNILKKLNDGKTITAREQQLLQEHEGKQDNTGRATDKLGEQLCTTADMTEWLGITPGRVSQLFTEGILIKRGKRFIFEDSIKNYIRNLQKMRTSKHGKNATMEELRQRLVDEQGRKEKALASLRELELRMKTESLISETDAIGIFVKAVTPLRRILDALPRYVSSQANPGKPAVAEKAIRVALDERVYTEMQRILEEQKKGLSHVGKSITVDD